MGERSRRFELFAARHPRCCYCGGGAQTAEIDHMPPKQMFIAKARPQGFEFPACSTCNRSSSLSESVACMLFRTKAFDDTDENASEMDAIIKRVAENASDVIQEMFFESPRLLNRKLKLYREFSRRDFEILNIGPIARTYLQNFAAKLGAACHYEHTGSIVPASGAIISDVRLGPEFWRGDYFPFEVDFVRAGTLMQGRRWSVDEQFAFRFAKSDSSRYGAYQAAFHENVVVTCIVVEDRSQLTKPAEGDNCRIPGALFRHPPRFDRNKIPLSINLTQHVNRPSTRGNTRIPKLPAPTSVLRDGPAALLRMTEVVSGIGLVRAALRQPHAPTSSR